MRVGQRANGTFRVERFNPLYIPSFDEAQHAYTISGRPAPSVTAIINAAMGTNPFWTQEGREAGRATHAAIQYYAEGDLDMGTVDPSIMPRLEAYILFCAETGFAPDILEQPMYHPQWLYCGTPDQVQTGRAVVDFKNGPHLQQHSLQLAGYAHMLPNPLKYERWGVHLKANGKYDIKVYPKQEMANDFAVFLSCLTTYNWRQKWQRS